MRLHLGATCAPVLRVDIAIALATFLLSLSAIILVAYAARVQRSGRLTHARLGPSPGSPMLPGWFVEAFYSAIHAPARLFCRLGVTPDALTYASLVLGLLSLPLLAVGRFIEGAVFIVFGAVLDAVDGMVAREQGVASPAGAVLDSFVDRVADAAPFVGLAIFYRHHPATLLVPIAAMIASSLVSYARAKADAHALVLPNGLMRRHERVVYLSASLLLGPVVPQTVYLGGVRAPLTLVGVLLIATVAAIASILLVARTRAALRSQSVSRNASASRVSSGPLPVQHRV